MIRRFLLAGAVALGGLTLATPPAQAMTCAQITSDVCATIGFVCSRLEYHRITQCNIYR